jgi:hypothetical protein
MAPAPIKSGNVKWFPTISLKFGFAGLAEEDAISIVRRITRDQFAPTLSYTNQCLYVVRLRGSVAVAYGDSFSPVLYIGEGDASNRIHGHAVWLASLLQSVPNLSVDIHIADIRRQNHTSLCEYVEADMIRWFYEKYGMLPWFNQQRERSKEEQYTYEPDVEAELRTMLNVGSGNAFLWAIRPTHNNHVPYAKYAKNSRE